MAYNPTVYVDAAPPAVSAVNLNKSESAIQQVDSRVTTLETAGYQTAPQVKSAAVALALVLGS
jgi:hypothetical protein